MAAAKQNIVIVDVEKVERLALEIRNAISEYLDREHMLGAEILLALNKASHNIVGWWIEAEEHKKCHT